MSATVGASHIIRDPALLYLAGERVGFLAALEYSEDVDGTAMANAQVAGSDIAAFPRQPALESPPPPSPVPIGPLISGHATAYGPGHFLTAHDDEVAGKKRHAAYVYNLTPTWRIDWGGLLLFHGADGHVARGFTPSFNALNLFAVPQPHSVSMVAPFAANRRYSVTGWLRGR